MEFAKKTFYRGTNVSPTPLKELHAALLSPTSLIEYSIRYSLSFANTIKLTGAGYRVLGGLSKPWYKLNSTVRYILLTLWLRKDPTLYLDSLQKVRRHLSSDHFLLTLTSFYKEFFRSERLAFDALILKLQKLELPLSVSSITIPRVPERLVIHLYNIVIQPLKVKFSNELRGLMFELKKTYYEDFSSDKVSDINRRLLSFIGIRSKANAILVTAVNLPPRITDDELSSRPGSIKAFQYHSRFAQVSNILFKKEKETRISDSVDIPLTKGFNPLVIWSVVRPSISLGFRRLCLPRIILPVNPFRRPWQHFTWRTFIGFLVSEVIGSFVFWSSLLSIFLFLFLLWTGRGDSAWKALYALPWFDYFSQPPSWFASVQMQVKLIGIYLNILAAGQSSVPSWLLCLALAGIWKTFGLIHLTSYYLSYAMSLGSGVAVMGSVLGGIWFNLISPPLTIMVLGLAHVSPLISEWAGQPWIQSLLPTIDMYHQIQSMIQVAVHGVEPFETITRSDLNYVFTPNEHTISTYFSDGSSHLLSEPVYVMDDGPNPDVYPGLETVESTTISRRFFYFSCLFPGTSFMLISALGLGTRTLISSIFG